MNTTISQIIFLYNNREHANYTVSVRAVEMMVHFCVQTYNVSGISGVSNTELLSNHTKISDVNYAFQDDGFMFLEEENDSKTQVLKWLIPDTLFGASLERIDVLSFGMLTAIFRGAVNPLGQGASSAVPFTETEIDVTTFANIVRIGDKHSHDYVKYVSGELHTAVNGSYRPCKPALILFPTGYAGMVTSSAARLMPLSHIL